MFRRCSGLSSRIVSCRWFLLVLVGWFVVLFLLRECSFFSFVPLVNTVSMLALSFSSWDIWWLVFPMHGSVMVISLFCLCSCPQLLGYIVDAVCSVLFGLSCWRDQLDIRCSWWRPALYGWFRFLLLTLRCYLHVCKGSKWCPFLLVSLHQPDRT